MPHVLIEENENPHLMFSSTNKEVIGIWSSEVHCSKSIEKSEVIQEVISSHVKI